MARNLFDPSPADPPPHGFRLDRRSRRVLGRIERHAAAEDPRLDDLLRGPVDHAARTGRRVGLTLLWLGLAMLAAGLAAQDAGLTAGGCVLLVLAWFPTQFRSAP